MNSDELDFQSKLQHLVSEHDALLKRENHREKYLLQSGCNGIIQRWANPVVTADHVPLHWRYDFSPESNPHLLERIGVNATFNAGAILWQGKYILVLRVEGSDRKSFFAVAESPNGVDQFRFWDRPLEMPETDDPDVNVYDMRLTQHEDGFIYGLFCTERKDQTRPGDASAAIANCGIARTKDLIRWERLPDLKSSTGQQRNVVLHPEFVGGKYGLYTRPQDGFIEVGSGGGIAWALVDSMQAANAMNEEVIDAKEYHTISELKNGQGPPPIKTARGWLHLAHGVRGTAAGLRYVLYLFLTKLDEPWRLLKKPGGYFLAPQGQERVGDVSNVVFSNGWIEKDGNVFVYYASSDTRMHVATTTVEKLLDYVDNTPADQLSSDQSVTQRLELIERNQKWMKSR